MEKAPQSWYNRLDRRRVKYAAREYLRQTACSARGSGLHPPSPAAIAASAPGVACAADSSPRKTAARRTVYSFARAARKIGESEKADPIGARLAGGDPARSRKAPERKLRQRICKCAERRETKNEIGRAVKRRAEPTCRAAAPRECTVCDIACAAIGVENIKRRVSGRGGQA